MKPWKIALIFFLMVGVVPAIYALTATWTHRSRRVQTVSGQIGVSCEYEYVQQGGGGRFWRTFVGDTCPDTVEVE
jgi:hypothetical protein